MAMRVLITGSSGLIGSEATKFFCEIGFEIVGVDNDMRADFFGPKGSTLKDRAICKGLQFDHTSMVEQAIGKKPRIEYSETNRIGDHICYYSDLRKLKAHFPDWKLKFSLPDIIEDMARHFSDNQD